MKTTLAEELFGDYIEGVGDAELNRMFVVLQTYKEKYPMSWRGLKKVPFCRIIIDMIDDQWHYRNDPLPAE